MRLPHVEIPWSVKEVAPECFVGADGEGQPALCSVTIPKNCQKIGRKAFAGCKNLQHVLVLGPTKIDDMAFISCHRLRHIELWRGVKSLGKNCLAFCESLPYVFIPKTVSRLGQSLAVQHSPNMRTPVFYCQIAEPAKGWAASWNLAYHDDNGQQPDVCHETVFGATPTRGSQHFLPHGGLE